MPAGDTQVVRIDLSQDRLATLGSEGMSWVLSLGDTLLAPTEPIELTRRRDIEGLFEIVADVARPARVHEFRDPVVGDVLKVVTAYPPARGVLRSFDYVDFSALRSVHGFVVKPEHLDVDVAIDNAVAVVKTPGGLTVSAYDKRRALDSGDEEVTRGSFIDLARLQETDPAEFEARRDRAGCRWHPRPRAGHATWPGWTWRNITSPTVTPRKRSACCACWRTSSRPRNLTRKVRMTLAIADTLAARPKEARGNPQRGIAERGSRRLDVAHHRARRQL